MKQEHFKIIKTFNNISEAKIAQSKLDANNIDSWLDNEHLASINWFYINLTGGIRLRVKTEDLEEAKIILNDINTEDNDLKIKQKTVIEPKSKRTAIWITIILSLIPILVAILIHLF
jgi:hypothetical protein